MLNLRQVSRTCAVVLALAIPLLCVVGNSGCGPATATSAGVQKTLLPSLAGHAVKIGTFTQVAPTAFEGTGTDAKGDPCRIRVTVSDGMLRYEVTSESRKSEASAESASSTVVFGSMPYME